MSDELESRTRSTELTATSKALTRSTELTATSNELMRTAMRPSRKGHYGLDAPYLLLIPAAAVAVNLWQAAVTRRPWPLIGAALIVLIAGFGWHSSRRGKFIVWNRILDDLALRGDERILDVGCGRGAVLLMAASRLTTGRAIGIDLWRKRDQSGNALEVTQRNAELEAVADRVTLETADMTALPFPAASFDLVVSSLAVHNVSGQDKRDRAIEEMVRVLKPGGRVALADLRHTARYRDRFAALGMADVAVTDLGWRMWWGGPWVPTRLVTARRA
jgi:arsenite methyltransferase